MNKLLCNITEKVQSRLFIGAYYREKISDKCNYVTELWKAQLWKKCNYVPLWKKCSRLFIDAYNQEKIVVKSNFFF